MQGKITDASRSKNSYMAWRQVTPWHNKLIEAMLNSPCHIIATMRSKTEYIQTENENGKKEIIKVGLAPVQREGMDYEFTTVFDLNSNHTVTATKDRTSIFGGQVFQLSEQTGETLRQWLESGVDFIPNVQKNKIYHQYLERYGDKDKTTEVINFITGNKPSKDWTQEDLESLQKGLL